MQPGGRRDEVVVRPDTDRSINADDLPIDRHMHEDRAGF